jgi:hypothetical protein
MTSKYRNAFLCRIGALFFVGLLAWTPLYGDMGAIHLHSQDVTVSEPAQKAIVLHNGSEEILILETDLKASARTDILRFIPFPAEPLVSLAPENALQEIGRLVQAKKLQFITIRQTKGGSSAQNQPVAEVVSRAKLGAHDVAVVKINDAAHFNQWVRGFFKDKKELLSGPELEQVSKVAVDYVKDGISYFAFDFVTVDDSDKTVAPVAFRFKSKKVYYPLRTSNTIGGEGQVQLYFIAIDCVRQPYNDEILRYIGGPERGNLLFSSIAEIQPEEANAVYPGAAAFFEEKRIVVQAAAYSGSLRFEQDLNSFMLTHYDPRLYQSSGAVQRPISDPSDFVPGWNPGMFGRENPVRNAKVLEDQRRHMTGLLVNGSFHLASVGRRVQFRDGRCKEDSMQVEINRIAFGELNGDIFSDAAVITEAAKKSGNACELTVFTGKEVQPFEKPQLERTASVLLKSCDVRDFSISERAVKIVKKGGAVESYKLLNGKLIPAE